MTNKTIPIASTACLVCCAICAALFLTPLETYAQDGHHRYDDATQLWRLTENAAGLSIDHKRNRGYAEFDLQHQEGDYTRVQEGGMRNQLTFEAERYQAIGKHLVGYGRFTFGMDRTKDRAWADVMRPYLSNPFYGGSSVHGKYDTQSFDFSAAIATNPLFKKKPVRSIERRKPRQLSEVLNQDGRPLPKLREIPKREIIDDDFDFIKPKTDKVEEGLRLGMRLDYRVGDLSRLRDPRSRSELLQYRLSPAATFTKGNSTIGLSGHYDRRKEKIPNMTTVQQDPNLMYYQMTGLGEATGLVGGYSGYQREWVNHELGAELTFGVHSSQFSNAQPTSDCELRTVNSIGIARGKEDVWGQYKYSPGQYTSYIYTVASRNRLRTDNVIHQLDIEAQWQQAYADEYRQQLIQEKDPEKGYTSYRYETQIAYKKRQQVSTVDASLHYRLSYHDRNCVTGYMGLFGELVGSTTKHLLPSSEQKLQRMNIALEGGHSFFDGRLWLDATATYSHAAKADLTLADPTTEIATQVLLPDMDYYDADYRRGQLSLKYIFPLTLKGHKNIFYVKAYGDVIKAQHSQDRKTVGLTFGLYN
jgi:hypothetical protein